MYDGFISYSHAADDLLAPRLQAGLQRFAKPWWKRRALRIFRDESSLAANPHLWSSITDALDGSGWFVLLLSPDAAASEWVNREVEYWLANKDPNRIIPVVTDGDFGWSDGEVVGDVPPALLDVFADEPRWVDLRFARTEEQLDLNNASFRAAVADVASAIRGIPKDELESEEVRQHRRTVRTAWGAGIALLFLVVVAGAAAVYANGQRNDANQQRLAAEESAAEADTQRQVAEDQTVVAESQTAVAEQLEFDARSDALAAGAIAQLDIDPELALLLATEALSREVQPVSLSATHQALQRNRTILQLAVTPGRFTPLSGAVGGLSPDGTQLVVSGQGPDLRQWDIDESDPVWAVTVGGGATTILDARFTADGTAIVAYVGGFAENPALDATELFIFDSETGEALAPIPNAGCRRYTLYPSALADYVDLTSGIPWLRAGLPCDPFVPLQVGLLDPATGSFSLVTEQDFQSFQSHFGVPTIDQDLRHFAVGSRGPGQVLDLQTGELVHSFDGGIATLSADGSNLLRPQSVRPTTSIPVPA